MPNGMERSLEYVSFFSRPLAVVDDVVTRFAERVQGSVMYNYHNWANRRVTVQDASGLERAILLTAIIAGGGASENSPAYAVGICAQRDTAEGRLWWAAEFKRLSMDEMTPQTLAPLLEQAWERLKRIDDGFLKSHGHLSNAQTRSDFRHSDKGRSEGD